MSGAADIDMLSCAAHFDGSAAGVDFFPAIQVLDEAGQVAATVVGSKVTAGDSADVTFAPFLESDSGGGGADPLAVHFNTSPSSNTYLDVETTGGAGMQFTAQGDTNIDLTVHGTGTEQITLSTDAGEILTESPVIVERLSPGGGHYRIQNSGGGTIVDVLESGDVTIRLESGGVLDVLGPFSRPILRVTDGAGGIPTYQGKTGGAWVFNL